MARFVSERHADGTKLRPNPRRQTPCRNDLRHQRAFWGVHGVYKVRVVSTGSSPDAHLSRIGCRDGVRPWDASPLMGFAAAHGTAAAYHRRRGPWDRRPCRGSPWNRRRACGRRTVLSRHSA